MHSLLMEKMHSRVYRVCICVQKGKVIVKEKKTTFYVCVLFDLHSISESFSRQSCSSLWGRDLGRGQNWRGHCAVFLCLLNLDFVCVFPS